MKKLMVIALAGVTALSMAGCAGGSSSSSSSSQASSTASTSAAAASSQTDSTAADTTAAEDAGSSDAAATTAEEAAADSSDASTQAAASDVMYPETKVDGDAMSYADYAAAEVDSPVIIDTYVQAKQGWWEDSSNGGVGTATLYTQTEEGGYFIYNIHMPQEDYDKLVEGQELKVSGYKSEWEGEVEIIDVDAYEIEDGNYVADPVDVTDALGTDDIINYQNQKVSFKNMTVAPAQDGSDAAFLYNYDGSGSQGDDLYFNVTKADDPDTTYTFTVESYLCGADTDVYKAVEALNVGDTIDLEGFLYYYEGPQPHITSVSAAQ